MNKLLFANFTRLKKNKYFWIGIICMFGLGTFIITARYQDAKNYNISYTIDDFLFYYTMFIGIVSSAFCSLYIGTEYSDGTIRNKLIIGHTRINIYLSNFIVCFVAGVFMILAFILPMLFIGIPCFGLSYHTPIQNILFTFFASLIMLMALTAFFIIFCMLIQNKAVSAVLTILGIFALLFAASYLMSSLDSPPTISDYYLDQSGNWQQGPETPNPRYITGIKRTVYETLLDILPTGQAIQYIGFSEIRWQLPLYSCLIVIVFILSGIFIFQKKDIK